MEDSAVQGSDLINKNDDLMRKIENRAYILVCV
jgi:hypothetical protein